MTVFLLRSLSWEKYFRVFLPLLIKRPDLHLGEPQRVVVAAPSLPHDAVGVCRCWSCQIGAVQVRIVAVHVPPGTFERHRARVFPDVVVLVTSTEHLSDVAS